MSTVAVRASRGATFWVPLHVFACGASILLAALDVLAEAQRLADEARQKRYQSLDE